MEREEWLKKMRVQAEKLYDHGAPASWVIWGMFIDDTHRRFIDKFVARLKAKSSLLDAACGAGRFDGILLEAGHTVIGIDQSAGVLTRAREHFPLSQYPGLEYIKLGLQEMDFSEKFDGIICMDAMEHNTPEDWPVILERFYKALKPGGLLYLTADVEKGEDDRTAFERGKAMGLPVVMGEIVDELDEAYSEAMGMDPLKLNTLSYDRQDHAVYHYHPSIERVHQWTSQAGLVILEEENTEEYEHLLLCKETN